MVGHAGMAATTRPRPASQRSAVSNGSKLFAAPSNDRMDAKWLRRVRDLISDFSAHVGGADTSQIVIIRRIAGIVTELELVELRMARGKGASAEDWDRYLRGTGILKRLLELPSMQRVALRDVTPLDDFDIEKEEAAAVEASE
jgi:hypothetical protein